MTFLSPYFLFLLLLIPAIAVFYIKTRKEISNTVYFPRTKMSGVLKKKSSYKYKDIPFVLIIISLSLFIVALSRPVIIKYKSDAFGEGIYISLVIDVSPSMLGEDLVPNRLEAAKDTLIKFIKNRNFDKISLVSFAMRASVLSPSTFDYDSLANAVSKIEIDEEGSTSIGLGMATAVDMLRNIDSKKGDKIIILLTDGDNNAGEIEPKLATEIANLYDIKIYTVGIGKPGIEYVWVTINDPVHGKNRVRMPFRLNEETLINIAKSTGGRYFNATSRRTLVDIYSAIHNLEKQEIKNDSSIEYSELFTPFALFGLLLLILAFVLKHSKFLVIP